jgi:hypothetical protein
MSATPEFGKLVFETDSNDLRPRKWDNLIDFGKIWAATAGGLIALICLFMLQGGTAILAEEDESLLRLVVFYGGGISLVYLVCFGLLMCLRNLRSAGHRTNIFGIFAWGK